MLDPIISLAFSVQSNKGVYALLLGSGLSRAAGIPTGWEVTLDLIRQSAVVHGEECERDPAAWFRLKFGREPDYSGLLDGLGKTPSDRANILARYFEPTEDDLREGRKAPTAAHKAIARLVAKGYFRVIVTTNFDRLMERALEAEGISPTVVSSADSAKGSLPLAHTRCTLLKIHGDYRDTRIRNTETELSTYELETDRMLDRILDEYGLVVCGWSAAWDEALRNCIRRCSTRRFSTFWAAKGLAGVEAQDLIKFRQASEIAIDSADKFFVDLETKIDALERYSQPHPLSKQLAVASLKKFIVSDQYRIELRDLVMQEADRQVTELSSLPMSAQGLDINAIFERMKRYEVSVETLVSLFVHGCYWGGPSHEKVWAEVLDRTASLAPMSGGMTHLLSLRIYPTCLLFYAGGVAAVAVGRYETLRLLCRDVVAPKYGENPPLALSAFACFALDSQIAQQFPGYERKYVPMSERIHDVLREPMREYLADDGRYDDAFDRFEYLVALVNADIQTAGGNSLHSPVGRFGWRQTIVEAVATEQQNQGTNWPPLQAGLFKDQVRFLEIQKAYSESILTRLGWY